MFFEIAILVVAAVLTGRLLLTVGRMVARAAGRSPADADRVLASAGFSLVTGPAPRAPRQKPQPTRDPEAPQPTAR